MDRRRVLQTGVVASSVLMAPAVLRAETGLTQFSVWRKGDDIGRHIVRKTRNGADLTIDIDIALKVTLAFIPLYTYSHNNQERWQDGKFLGFQSQTDDNGDEFRVNASLISDQLIAETSERTIEHPAQRRATTYWHKSFLQNPIWINSQTGETVVCEIVEQGPRSLALMGQSVDTAYFRLRGDLNIELWYLGDDWVKLIFTGEDGSIIEYQLEELQQLETGLG